MILTQDENGFPIKYSTKPPFDKKKWMAEHVIALNAWLEEGNTVQCIPPTESAFNTWMSKPKSLKKGVNPVPRGAM